VLIKQGFADRVEYRHTAIAHGAVFGPNRAAHKATGAEGGGLKADSTSLRKLYDGLWGINKLSHLLNYS